MNSFSKYSVLQSKINSHIQSHYSRIRSKSNSKSASKVRARTQENPEQHQKPRSTPIQQLPLSDIDCLIKFVQECMQQAGDRIKQQREQNQNLRRENSQLKELIHKGQSRQLLLQQQILKKQQIILRLQGQIDCQWPRRSSQIATKLRMIEELRQKNLP